MQRAPTCSTSAPDATSGWSCRSVPGGKASRSGSSGSTVARWPCGQGREVKEWGGVAGWWRNGKGGSTVPRFCNSNHAQLHAYAAQTATYPAVAHSHQPGHSCSLTTASHLRRCSGGGARSHCSACSTLILSVLTRAVRGCGVMGPGSGSSSAADCTPASDSSCCSAAARSACGAMGAEGG